MSEPEDSTDQVIVAEADIEAFKSQNPLVCDLYLPPSANNRFALVKMDKTQAGQSQPVIKAVLAFLAPYADVKFVVLCDDDVNIRDWHDIIWAITTRMDPARDTVRMHAQGGRVSKLVMDATNKFEGEVQREWGTPIKKDPKLVAKIDAIWDELSIL